MTSDVGIPSGHPTIGVPDTAQLKIYLESHLVTQRNPRSHNLGYKANSCKPYLAAYIKPVRGTL